MVAVVLKYRFQDGLLRLGDRFAFERVGQDKATARPE
jgi:hypothetical protein